MITRVSSRQPGFTLIELLVVIAIIAILAAILFPVFLKAKITAQTSKCMSNMRQIGMAIMNYSNDWHGNTPFAYDAVTKNMWDWENNNWRAYIRPYTKSKGVFRCPIITFSDDSYKQGRIKDRYVHYGINTWLFYNYWISAGKPEHCGWWNLSQVPIPSKTIMICENEEGDFAGEPYNNTDPKFNTGGEGKFYPYHGEDDSKGGVFIFNDGHAKFLSVWQTQAGSTPSAPKSYYLWMMKDNIQPAL